MNNKRARRLMELVAAGAKPKEGLLSGMSRDEIVGIYRDVTDSVMWQIYLNGGAIAQLEHVTSHGKAGTLLVFNPAAQQKKNAWCGQLLPLCCATLGHMAFLTGRCVRLGQLGLGL